ncbi:hypothetical protein KJ039_09990 [bacterium]|nr:hypothetical protein [bacterium]
MNNKGEQADDYRSINISTTPPGKIACYIRLTTRRPVSFTAFIRVYLRLCSFL